MAVAVRPTEIVPTGLPFGTVRWGAHLCHFYRTTEDLEEILVPFFAAGIENHEKCVWLVQAPMPVRRAREALAARFADLDRRIGDGQVAIIDRAQWSGAGVDSERRIAQWLEREQSAIAEGFNGLRITGDTSWTEPVEWRALAAHEARMHRALHGRRIAGLCSYHLDRCGPHEIIDVLRNHRSALLRREGRWEHIGSATAALALVAAPPAVSQHHTVEFFEPEQFPAASMARRLCDALAKDQAAVALCTRAHLAELRAAIERRIDPATPLATGRLLLLDAESVHAEVLAAVDFESAVDALVGNAVRDVLRRFGTARVYSELVDVCCANGRRDLAVTLEGWWTRQLEVMPIELHCGYSAASFDDAESMDVFRRICDGHGHVFASRQIDATDPSRLAAELQQTTAILQTESARRVAAECAITTSRTAEQGAREHLVVLQRVTSALGEAVTFDNIGEVVTAELVPAVEATRIALVIDGELISLRGITTPDEPSLVAQALDHAPARWSTAAELPAELRWIGGALVAVIPLMFAQDRIGTIVLGFDRPTISIAHRALVDDLVRQLSQTVERARMFEQAEKERVRAESANAAKEQFMAMLGHELRNPLSPILSATQLMRLRNPDQVVKERATIERSVSHMIRIVDDLLDISQLSRGQVTLAREPSELAAIVESALEVARGVIEGSPKFEVSIPPQLIVDVDSARMRQVVSKLVINAAKHTRGSQAIEISACARGETVELVVRDHGDGIDPMVLPHVFELFVQGRQGSDRSLGGLGVGLAIARSIVELHGGTIAVVSASGSGSTFTVTLPRWQTERTTDQIAVPAVAGGRRILVVDDNEDAAWLLAEALRLLGHDVRVAYEGISALEVANDWSPEIALLDIGLPGMNGLEVCRELRKLAARPHCIAVSGYGQPKDRELAREAGFDAHFVKPVDLRDVQAAIEALSTAN